MDQKFHVQNKFTKTNHISIKKIYGIPEKEILWICFFAGNQFSLPLRKCGFVFTDKALYYQYPVKMLENGGIEKLQKKSGKILLNSTKVDECLINSDGNKFSLLLKVWEDLSKEEEKKSEKEADISLGQEISRTYTFELFPNAPDILPELAQKNACMLENIFKLYFSKTLQIESFDEDDESYSALFTIFATKDFAAETFLQLKGKFSRFFGTVKTKVSGKKTELKERVRVSKEQKVEKEKAKAEAEKSERVQKIQAEEKVESQKQNIEREEQQNFDSAEKYEQTESEQNARNDENKSGAAEDNSNKKRSEKEQSRIKGGFVRIGHFFRHLFDLCADLSFMLFVLLCVKPQVLASEVFTEYISSGFYKIDLKNLTISKVHKLFGKFDVNFFCGELYANLSENIKKEASFWIIIFAVVFLIIKILVITSCKNSRRVVSFLLLTILCITSALIPHVFLVFILLAPLILLTLQFSMGFNSRAIISKISLFFIFTICGYISIHLVRNPDLCDVLVQIFAIPVKLW